MIHPTDFDSVPAGEASDEASGAGSKTTRLWKIACVLLAGLCLVMTAAWFHATDAAVQARVLLDARISDLVQERDTLKSTVSQFEEQAKVAARSVRVTVTGLQVFSIIDGSENEPPDGGFIGSGVKTIRYRVQGRHPLCGKDEFKQPLMLTVYMPNGDVFKHPGSPEAGTSSLDAWCAPNEAQWSVDRAIGYTEPGNFAIGTWRAIVTDREGVVARKDFDVR